MVHIMSTSVMAMTAQGEEIICQVCGNASKAQKILVKHTRLIHAQMFEKKFYTWDCMLVKLEGLGEPVMCIIDSIIAAVPDAEIVENITAIQEIFHWVKSTQERLE